MTWTLPFRTTIGPGTTTSHDRRLPAITRVVDRRVAAHVAPTRCGERRERLSEARATRCMLRLHAARREAAACAPEERPALSPDPRTDQRPRSHPARDGSADDRSPRSGVRAADRRDLRRAGAGIRHAGAGDHL